jgi:IclR family KDG regulon transcriptional repressor
MHPNICQQPSMSEPKLSEQADESTKAPVASSSVQAVGVAFAVLEELANTPEAVGTSEIARRLGQTKARVHRHLSTLRELGFVEKDSASDRYRLGWKSYRLGISVGENFGLRKLALQHLIRLHHDSGQTVALAIPAGQDVTVIDAIQSTAGVAITVRPGSVIPAVSSALGRVILAFQPEVVRAQALAAPIFPLTAQTPQDAQQVGQMLDAVRERWYEVAVNERLPGVAALAAPVFDDRNRVVGSVCVIGSHAVVTQPPPAALLRQVQEAAARISAELRSSVWDGAQLTSAAPS